MKLVKLSYPNNWTLFKFKWKEDNKSQAQPLKYQIRLKCNINSLDCLRAAIDSSKSKKNSSSKSGLAEQAQND